MGLKGREVSGWRGWMLVGMNEGSIRRLTGSDSARNARDVGGVKIGVPRHFGHGMRWMHSGKLGMDIMV
jgi:hypothetical protein